jgi:hypothetical protein
MGTWCFSFWSTYKEAELDKYLLALLLGVQVSGTIVMYHMYMFTMRNVVLCV